MPVRDLGVNLTLGFIFCSEYQHVMFHVERGFVVVPRPSVGVGVSVVLERLCYCKGTKNIPYLQYVLTYLYIIYVNTYG